MKRILSVVACCFAAIITSHAQVTLTGTSYTQNFNTISNGLPAGWTVRSGSSASSLGASAAFTGAAFSWGDSGGSFKNFAGTVGNGGVSYTGSEAIATQHATTNRTLGVRQTGSLGDPGAAFVVQLANTLGYENFELSLDFNMLSVQTRSTIWKLEYGLGSTPSSFTQVGTDYTDPGAFGTTTKTFTFPAAIADQNQNVWIRIVALTASTGSGSRDSFGIDNFHLTYSVAIPPEGPPVITAQPQGATVWKGTNVTFTVEATGAEPLSYQWFLNDSPIANATNAVLALSNVGSANAGTYRVEVSNVEDTVSSETAELIVQLPVSTTIAGLRALVDTVNWLPPTSDTIYEIEGFVTTRVDLSTGSNASFYLQDATGGIAVFVSSTINNDPLYQDRVRVTGRLTHFNGLLQLLVETANPTHKCLIFGPSTPIGPPILLDLATQFDIPEIEALEGSLVVVSNVVLDTNQLTFASGTTVRITNAFDLSQSFDLRIDSRVTELHGKTKPPGFTTIIGVLSQHSTSDPRTNGYQILPTSFWNEVLPGPQITTHPVSQNVIVGESASFTVSALNHGIGALTYQWRKNGVDISGATTSAYSIPNTTVADTGMYSVVVRNGYAGGPSANAYLGVGTGSVSVMMYNVKGNFAEDFTAAGSQVQAIGRQLAYLQPDIVTFNEIPVGKTYIVTNLATDYLPGYFYATNSGSDGSIRSVILSRWRVLRSESWLDGAPLDAYGYAGNFTRDLFEAEVEVPGYVQPLHVFTTHLKSGSGLDECLKRAAEANAISNYFVNGFLTTNSGRPYVLTGDLNEDINRPSANNQQAVQAIRNTATGLQLTTPLNPFTLDDRTFSIQSPPLAHRYDYILPSSSLSAQISTSQVFRTSVLAPLPGGLNANDDSTASDHLPVLVHFNNPSFVPPIFLTQPEDRVGAAGSSVSFTVEVASATTVTYRWRKGEVELANGGNVSGADTATLTLGSISELDAGVYSVIASNVYGAVISDDATLTIAVAPTIVSDPVTSTNVAGTTATFTVSATGTEPLAYQWKKDNSPLSNGGKISGADSATLVIANVAAIDQGAYSVTVTNIAGTVDSAAAELYVFTAPAITVQPTSRTIAEAATTSLSVTATGTAPLTYQWYLNSAEISGATDSSYSILNAAQVNAGNYVVVVSNYAGTATSTAALVKVALPATALSPENLVVLRLGDSVQGMANTGNSAYLDQFTTTGDYLSTMAIPDSGASAVILAGNASSEGALSRSENGIYLTFGGYNITRPHSSSVSGASSATVPRAVAQVNAAGTYTIPVKTTSHYSGGSIRGVATDGGDNYWGAGASSGTYYLGVNSSAATVQSSPSNTRVINTHNGNLYFSTQSGTVGLYRIPGTPSSATPATLWIATGGSPYGFIISPDETIVYIADDSGGGAGGVHRWDLVDGVWVKSYAIATGGTSGARGVVADFSGPSPVIYATTGETTGNRLIRIVDVGAGSVADTLANAGANQVFRGVQFAPEAAIAPAIVSDPTSLDLLQGETTAFTVSASGTGPLKYQWLHNGSPISGATTATYTIGAVLPEHAGDYSVSVSNMVSAVTSATATLTVEADPITPILKVLSPKANFVYTNASLLINGTAQDTVLVKSVEYDLNGALFDADLHYVAPGKASNWNATINLQPGTNTLTVTATDLAGNTTPLSYKFYYHTASPLTIVKTLNGGTDLGTNHVGTVINTIPSSLFSGNNTNLFVGRTYTLKVVEDGLPKFGFILTNWTATWVGQASPVVVQTNSLICTFEMKEGMVLKANFISNPFYRFGGTYLGLFSDTNGVAFHSAGYAQVKVTPKLTFSAKLLVDGNPVSIAGKLKIDGTGSATSKARFKVTDKPELTVDLALDFAGGTENLSGAVSQGGDTPWTSELLAYRNVWSKTNVLEQAGIFATNYTMQVPGFATLAEGPVGTASGGLKVDVRGKVVLTGVGSDMHLMKQATWISEGGHWPFFSPMYKVKRTNALNKLIAETRGFAMGWLQFTTNGIGNYRPAGEVHTIKTTWVNDLYTPGWTNGIYEGGFTNSADVVASRWSYDALNPQASLPGISGVVIDFLEGDLGSAFTGTWAVTPKSTFAPIKDNDYPNTVKAALVPKTGVFKGTFIHPSNSALTKYQGVLLQDGVTGSGAGTFIGPDNGGKVTVSQAPETP